MLAAALVASIDVAAHDRVTTKVTWNREISPIIQARCAGCHARGGSSTIPLTTYKEARPWAASIKEEVLTRRMPVWKAARGYGDFANDPSLSPFEIALIAAWADGGAPEISDRDKAQGANGQDCGSDRARIQPTVEEHPGPESRVRGSAADRPAAGGDTAAREGIVSGDCGDAARRPAPDRCLDPGLRSGSAGDLLAAETARPAVRQPAASRSVGGVRARRHPGAIAGSWSG